MKSVHPSIPTKIIQPFSSLLWFNLPEVVGSGFTPKAYDCSTSPVRTNRRPVTRLFTHLTSTMINYVPFLIRIFELSEIPAVPTTPSALFAYAFFMMVMVFPKKHTVGSFLQNNTYC